MAGAVYPIFTPSPRGSTGASRVLSTRLRGERLVLAVCFLPRLRRERLVLASRVLSTPSPRGAAGAAGAALRLAVVPLLVF